VKMTVSMYTTNAELFRAQGKVERSMLIGCLLKGNAHCFNVETLKKLVHKFKGITQAPLFSHHMFLTFKAKIWQIFIWKIIIGSISQI